MQVCAFVVARRTGAAHALRRRHEDRPHAGRSRPAARTARRMGGAKRYPSIASYRDDGFRRLNPSYVLNLHWSFAALFMRKTDGVDNETGSSDLPVGRFVDGGVKLFFGFSEKYFRS